MLKFEFFSIYNRKIPLRYMRLIDRQLLKLLENLV